MTSTYGAVCRWPGGWFWSTWAAPRPSITALPAPLACGLATTEAAALGQVGAAVRLVALKAVDGGYPLRGQLGVAERPGARVQPSARGPEPGTAWIAPCAPASTTNGACIPFYTIPGVGYATNCVGSIGREATNCGRA